jgi:hypothetical protein
MSHGESGCALKDTRAELSRVQVSRSGRALQKEDGGRRTAAQREVVLLCGCAALLRMQCMVALDREKIKMISWMKQPKVNYQQCLH